MVTLIDGYRFFLSPWVGQHCRFDPTCSRYAREAILCHGPLRGAWLALRRLSRCHPWHDGGHAHPEGLRPPQQLSFVFRQERTRSAWVFEQQG